jgi:hypothetical protein
MTAKTTSNVIPRHKAFPFMIFASFPLVGIVIILKKMGCA